jgi:hypothetical protein
MKLRVVAKQLIDEAFTPRDPRTIHRHLGMEDCLAILAKLKSAFIHCPKYKYLLPDVFVRLAAAGPPWLHTRTKYGIRGREP